MSTLDVRAGAWSVTGTPGTSREVTFTWLDEAGDPYALGDVSVWVGGTITDPTDFTGATEYVAAVASNVATVTVLVPDTREVLRLTLDGVLMALGAIRPSTRGAETPGDEVTVQVDAASVAISLGGPPGPIGGMVALDEEGYVVALVPSTVGDASLELDGDGLVLLTIGD